MRLSRPDRATRSALCDCRPVTNRMAPPGSYEYHTGVTSGLLPGSRRRRWRRAARRGTIPARCGSWQRHDFRSVGRPRPHQLIAPVPWTGHGFDIPGTDRLAARPAHEHRLGDRAAPLVDDLHRRPRRGCVTVPPLPHGGEDGPEVPALVGEPVVVAWRVLGVRDPRQDARVDQAGRGAAAGCCGRCRGAAGSRRSADPKKASLTISMLHHSPRPRGTGPPSSPCRRSSSAPCPAA